jgi:glycosyltransferase involved in cell wall biosynthesis
MKIALITSFPFPDGKATANRVKVFVEELIKSPKIEFVDIYCCSENAFSSERVSDVLRVTNLKINKINKNNLVIRAFSELHMAFRLWRHALNSGSDLTLVTVPSMLLLVPFVLNPFKGNIALDLRDAVWTYFGNGFLSRVAGKILAWLFRSAAGQSLIISVTNSEEYSEIQKLTGITPLVIGNGISEVKLAEMKSIVKEEVGRLQQLTYIGNVGIAQELHQLIDFSRTISNLQIIVVGDGAKLKELVKKCESENIDNVSFTGLVKPSSVKNYIKSADILFAQIGARYKTAVPTKVFEYIASGRKVLLGLPEGPAKIIFSEFYGVEIFEVGNQRSFVQHYSRLLSIEISQEHRDLNIKLLEKQYLREKSARKLVAKIEDIIV